MESQHELRESIRSCALRMLQNGFLVDEALEQNLRNYADDAVSDFDLEIDDDALHQVAMEELAAARKAHRADMATWPKVTDCDRLDAAFTELNAMGIMARHNWTCCNNCGSAEMPEEFRRLNGKINAKPIIGYIFYHQQGTDNAVDSGGVYFSFGSTQKADSEKEYEERSVAIAQTACDVLAKHALKTVWNGTYDQRPCVKLDWKRRGMPKDYLDCDGPGHGAPSPGQQSTPRSAPGTTMNARPSLIARIGSIFTRKK